MKIDVFELQKNHYYGYACRGVLWRGVLWRGAFWRDVARRGVFWRAVVRRNVAWSVAAWRGVLWRGELWRGVLWRGVLRRGVLWRDVACFFFALAVPWHSVRDHPIVRRVPPPKLSRPPTPLGQDLRWPGSDSTRPGFALAPSPPIASVPMHRPLREAASRQVHLLQPCRPNRGSSPATVHGADISTAPSCADG